MIITFDETYAQITISESIALDAFIANSSFALNLEVTRNCGTVTTHVISLDDINVVDSEYVVTASTLGYGEVFAEGVYRFRLKYQDNPILIDTVFKYINDSLTCRIINWYAEYLECLEDKPCDQNIFYWVFVFDNLLQRFADGSCSDFTYTNACKLYTKLLALLDDTTHDDCGCD